MHLEYNRNIFGVSFSAPACFLASNPGISDASVGGAHRIPPIREQLHSLLNVSFLTPKEKHGLLLTHTTSFPLRCWNSWGYLSHCCWKRQVLNVNSSRDLVHELGQQEAMRPHSQGLLSPA